MSFPSPTARSPRLSGRAAQLVLAALLVGLIGSPTAGASAAGTTPRSVGSTASVAGSARDVSTDGDFHLSADLAASIDATFTGNVVSGGVVTGGGFPGDGVTGGGFPGTVSTGGVVKGGVFAGSVSTGAGPGAVPTGAVSTGSPRWVWPVGPTHVLARPFVAPATRYSAGHRGIDIVAAEGTVVVAPADGIVHFAGTVVDRPVVSIEHPGGLISSFEPVTTTLVEGEPVARGSPIGTLASGHCSAGCLHLGVRLHGEYLSPLVYLGEVRPSVLLPTRPIG